MHVTTAVCGSRARQRQEWASHSLARLRVSAVTPSPPLATRSIEIASATRACPSSSTDPAAAAAAAAAASPKNLLSGSGVTRGGGAALSDRLKSAYLPDDHIRTGKRSAEAADGGGARSAWRSIQRCSLSDLSDSSKSLVGTTAAEADVLTEAFELAREVARERNRAQAERPGGLSCFVVLLVPVTCVPA